MPERELWQEVLFQAITDARLGASADPVPERAIHETAKARDYLTNPSDDLEQVCAWASVDLNALLDRMRKQAAELPALDLTKVSPPRSRDRLYEHKGRSLTVKQWALITGISASVIYDRLQRGLSVAETLTSPVRVRTDKRTKR